MKRHSKEFRKEVVDFFLENQGEISKRQIAKNFGTSVNSIDRWVRDYRESQGTVLHQHQKSVSSLVKEIEEAIELLKIIVG